MKSGNKIQLGGGIDAFRFESGDKVSFTQPIPLWKRILLWPLYALGILKKRKLYTVTSVDVADCCMTIESAPK